MESSFIAQRSTLPLTIYNNYTRFVVLNCLDLVYSNLRTPEKSAETLQLFTVSHMLTADFSGVGMYYTPTPNITLAHVAKPDTYPFPLQWHVVQISMSLIQYSTRS